MKKYLIIVLTVILFLAVGCKKDEDDRVIKVLLPSGTPLMAVGDLLDNENFNFEIVNGQDPLKAAFVTDDYDMIIAPLNLGAKLYIAGNSQYKFEAIITTNNTYIMNTKEISSINELEGKTIMAFGSGSSPWIGLKASLTINNVNATISTQTSASDVASLFIAGSDEADYFLGAEPNITVMRVKKNMTVYTLDVSSVIKDQVSTLIQAALFVNPNSKDLDKYLDLIKNGISKMNNNPTDYAASVVNKNEFFNTLGETVIAQAIPNANITYLKASDNMKIINEYYIMLNTYVNAVLGGSTPDESFYY